jgi:hypothetical protein
VRSHHAEESQWLLREAHQEEHSEDIEYPVGVLAHRVTAVVTVEWRLRQVDLDDAEALPVREHREKPMLVAIKRDFLEHAPLHGTNAAAEVVETLATSGNQTVKRITAHHLEAATDSWPTAPDSQIGLVERIDQFADLDALDLVIGRDRQNHTSGRTLKSCHERSSLTEALREADDNEILAAFQQPLQRRRDIRPWPIQHHDELVGRAKAVETSLVLRVQGANVTLMAIAYRHDHRQGEECGLDRGSRHEGLTE